jgi:hypothetical protein
MKINSKKRAPMIKVVGLMLISVAYASMADTNPNLQVGAWTNITPSGSMGATGVYHMALAPSDPTIIYLSSDKCGMWKTTNSGKDWVRLGNPNGYFNDSATDYLDDPCQVNVDPADPNHVIVCEGVDGGRDGFWVSRDGGNTWKMPKGFRDVGKIVGGGWMDVVMMSVDPGDFNHVIVSTHSDWNITAGYSSGIYETRDGGATFTYHLPPNDAWSAGTKGIHLLHHPASGTGTTDTWLVCNEGNGFWRTSDAGKNWTKVSDEGSPHGGNQSYYSSNGTLDIGAYTKVDYSTDNGITWNGISGLPYTNYSAICGTGTTIYTQGTNNDCGASIPYYTSLETNGKTWTSSAGAPKASSWEMKFDPVNHILYSANRCGGFWALKVSGSTITASTPAAMAKSVPIAVKRSVVFTGKYAGLSVGISSKAESYTIRGEMIRR